MTKPDQTQNGEHDQAIPPTKRAIIYLSEVCRPGSEESQFELPISLQRVRCRHTADRLQLEVVGEFVDQWFDETRTELRRALELAGDGRIDYLLVSSQDRLERTTQDLTFEVAWRLGHAGTVAMLADGDDFPWKSVTTPSRA